MGEAAHSDEGEFAGGGAGCADRPLLPHLPLDGLVSRELEVPRLVQLRRRQKDPGPRSTCRWPSASSWQVRCVQCVQPRLRRPPWTTSGSLGSPRSTGLWSRLSAPWVPSPTWVQTWAHTPEGQTAALAGLGITDGFGPVPASTEAVAVAQVVDIYGHVVTEALSVDQLLVVNRLKGETSSSGRAESTSSRSWPSGSSSRARGAAPARAFALGETQRPRPLLDYYDRLMDWSAVLSTKG